jgi:hypothetical protein
LRICERWGYRDVPELIDKYLLRTAVLRFALTAVMSKSGHVEEKSPDVVAGWCGLCDSDTMRSALVLAGIL